MSIYIKYTSPDLQGDVTTQGHDKQIEVQSFQWGVSRSVGAPTGAAVNREATTPSVSEVTVTKYMDNASGGLLKEALKSGGNAQMVIYFVRTNDKGSETYHEITLSNVMVSGYNLSCDVGKPSETISFNFTKIESKFTPMKTDGSLGSPFPVTYDLGKQTLS